MKLDWDSYILDAIVTILLFFMCILWLSKFAYSEERLIRPYPFIMESDGNPNSLLLDGTTQYPVVLEPDWPHNRRLPTIICPNSLLLDGQRT